MKKEIKWIKDEFGWEAQVNGEYAGFVWKTTGASKYYISYPTEYFYHLKDAKLALAARINSK